MQFLRPGRLVHVKDGTVDWSWGVLVRPRRVAANIVTPKSITEREGVAYTLDVLLLCSAKSAESKRQLMNLQTCAPSGYMAIYTAYAGGTEPPLMLYGTSL